jgi:hypothetical protein
MFHSSKNVRENTALSSPKYCLFHICLSYFYRHDWPSGPHPTLISAPFFAQARRCFQRYACIGQRDGDRVRRRRLREPVRHPGVCAGFFGGGGGGRGLAVCKYLPHQNICVANICLTNICTTNICSSKNILKNICNRQQNIFLQVFSSEIVCLSNECCISLHHMAKAFLFHH